MRELVHVQVGQCGNQIGTKFWEVISEEHGIDPNGEFEGDSEQQLERLNVYYNETTENRFVPRAVLVDLDSCTMDMVRASTVGQLFSPQNFIFGKQGTGGNYTTGFLTDGLALIDTILDVIRKESEACDYVQGYQLCHSLGGGTGSGLGTLINTKIHEEFSDKIKFAFSVFPSKQTQDCVLESYNSCFCLGCLLDVTDLIFAIDNEALYDICFRTLKLTNPTFGDLNHIVSLVMSSVTCGLRFPGQLNCDMRKMATNLVPFVRMKTLVCSFAPLACCNSQAYHAVTVSELIQQMFDNKSTLASCDPKHGLYVCGSAIFRGSVPTRDVEEQILNIRERNSKYFVQWIPRNILIGMCDIPIVGMKMSSLYIGNTTAIKEVVGRIFNQFEAMKKKKAYFHQYTCEGFTDDDFIQVETSLMDLITEYKIREATEVHHGGEGAEE